MILPPSPAGHFRDLQVTFYNSFVDIPIRSIRLHQIPFMQESGGHLLSVLPNRTTEYHILADKSAGVKTTSINACIVVVPYRIYIQKNVAWRESMYAYSTTTHVLPVAPTCMCFCAILLLHVSLSDQNGPITTVAGNYKSSVWNKKMSAQLRPYYMCSWSSRVKM